LNAQMDADYQKRQEPNLAWKSAVSTITALPALRAFWPLSSAEYTAAGQARDLGAGNYGLTNNNAVTFGSGGAVDDNLVFWADFNGTTQFLSRADGGAANWADIRGNEAWVRNTQRGLTMGGWFKFDSVAGAGVQRFMSKDDGVVRAYSMYLREPTSDIRFEYFTGAAVQTITSAWSILADTWYYIVGRFHASTEHNIIINATINTAGHANATIDDGTGAFEIGRWQGGGGSQYFGGQASLCYLCAAALPWVAIWSVFEQTKTMFGVE
jgi:hypothetical protein